MTSSTQKLPVWYWVAAGAALIWNLFGVTSFLSLVTMSAETLAAMPAPERALYEDAPVWPSIIFAIAVFSGVLGSLGLLLRKSWAVPVFVLSLVAIIVQFGHWLLFTEATSVYGGATYPMPIMVTAVGAILVWFSHRTQARGWLS